MAKIDFRRQAGLPDAPSVKVDIQSGVMQATVKAFELSQKNIFINPADTVHLFSLPPQHIVRAWCLEIVVPETVLAVATVSFGYDGGAEFVAGVDAKVLSDNTLALGGVVPDVYEPLHKEVTLLLPEGLKDAIIKAHVEMVAFPTGHEEV